MRVGAITPPPSSVVCTLPNGPVAQARIGEAVHFRNAERGIGTPGDHRINDEFDDVKHPVGTPVRTMRRPRLASVSVGLVDHAKRSGAGR
jgi:hypothetical protein